MCRYKDSSSEFNKILSFNRRGLAGGSGANCPAEAEFLRFFDGIKNCEMVENLY